MKRIFLFALALVAAALVVSTGAVAAQSANETAGEETLGNGCELVSGPVYVCERPTLEDDRAVMEVYVTEDTEIALGDSSVFVQGGQVDPQEFELEAEERTNVSIGVDEADSGFRGVYLMTEGGYFEPFPLEQSSPLLPGEPSMTDVIVGVGTTVALVVVAVPASWYGVRRMRGVVRRVF